MEMINSEPPDVEANSKLDGEINNPETTDVKGNSKLPANGEKGKLRLQIVNVSGTKFQMLEEIWTEIRKRIPIRFQQNTFICDNEVFVARDPRAFQAILYEQLGSELHIPSDMCPSVFRKELEFWGIEGTDLAKCCFVKYMAYFEDQDALKILEIDERRKTEDKLKLERMSYQHGWRGIQAKMWLILNEPYHSNFSKVYFILHILLITISLFALVAGTHHSFQRPLNIDEWKLYFGDEWDKYKHYFYGDADLAASNSQAEAEPHVVPETEAETEVEPESEAESTAEPKSTAEPESEAELGAEPESTAEPESEAELTAEPEVEAESEFSSTTIATSEPTEIPTSNTEGDATVSTEPNVISTTAFLTADDSEMVTDSEPCDIDVQAEADDTSDNLPLPENTRARFVFLDVIEFTSIAFFTIDLTVRIVMCPDRIGLLYSFLHWVDVFALAVMYAKYIVEAIYPREKYEASVLDILHCLQVVRILQMFRLVQNSVGFRVLLYAFKASFIELTHMSLFLFVAMLLFSTCIYFSGDTNFPNIPDAFWWSLITMTTVGYGDMVPQDPLSRLIGVLCAITGVCVIAVIIPIFVNNFMLFYTYSKVWGERKDTKNLKYKVKVTQVAAVDTLT